MSTDLAIPDAELDEWLEVLKPYQRSKVLEFVQSGTAEEAAQRWLGASGSPNIAAFGGESSSRTPFWERFKAEFSRFLCDDGAYAEEKKRLQAEGSVAKQALVGAISAGVGAVLGHAATLLVPAVVLMLYIVGKMGRNAFCAMLAEPAAADADAD